MKLLLSKKGLKTKSASEVGRKKVDIYRGKDFKKFLLSSEDILKKKCSGLLKNMFEGRTALVDKDIDRIGNELIQKGFCYKAMYQPLSQSDSGAEKKPKKWPDRVGKTSGQNFDSDAFYVIIYESNSGMRHFLLGLIIAGVLLACLFPVWPIWAKIALWYLTVLFLSLYFGLLIIRMVIYFLFWIIGFEFWIFPNLNDEYCGIKDSFQPTYSWEKRKDDWLTVVVRFGFLAMVAIGVEHISQTHSLSDVRDFVEASYGDVIDWGIDKMTYLPGSEKLALPSLEQLEKQNEEGEDILVSDEFDDDIGVADSQGETETVDLDKPADPIVDLDTVAGETKEAEGETESVDLDKPADQSVELETGAGESKETEEEVDSHD